MFTLPQFREFQKHTKAQRQKSLDEMHLQLKKFIDKRLQSALVSEPAPISNAYLHS